MTKIQAEPEGIYETVGKYSENTYEAVSPFASENLYEVVDTNIDPNRPYVYTVTVKMGTPLFQQTRVRKLYFLKNQIF